MDTNRGKSMSDDLKGLAARENIYLTRPVFPILLGIDPGLANFGWALVEIANGELKPLQLGVIGTQKDSKKTNVRASDDNIRRARELYLELERITATRQPLVICAEAMSFPRSAGSAGKLAMSWGVVAAFAEAHGIPDASASPQAIKKNLTGSGAASKEDVQLALIEKFQNKNLFLGLLKTEREHAADALAAIVACQDNPAVRMAAKLSCTVGSATS